MCGSLVGESGSRESEFRQPSVASAARTIEVAPEEVHDWIKANVPRQAEAALVGGNGLRAWEWRKILWWAGETDRLRSPRLLDEYKSVFGHRPPTRNARRAARGVTYPSLPGLDVNA